MWNKLSIDKFNNLHPSRKLELLQRHGKQVASLSFDDFEGGRFVLFTLWGEYVDTRIPNKGKTIASAVYRHEIHDLLESYCPDLPFNLPVQPY